jgi:hypothetical protein
MACGTVYKPSEMIRKMPSMRNKPVKHAAPIPKRSVDWLMPTVCCFDNLNSEEATGIIRRNCKITPTSCALNNKYTGSYEARVIVVIVVTAVINNAKERIPIEPLTMAYNPAE